jgi:sacsin
MINQLRCFSLLNKNWEHHFDGTIIRLPLRTASQAVRSEISSESTSVDDILCSMRVFADEIGSEGLLFLKSVQQVVLEVDDKCLYDVAITNGLDLKE